MNNQFPAFNPNFKYQNIGQVVGTLTYAKELERKDGSSYGHEFLLNSSGYGSINVRIPMLQRSQESFDNFPVAEKPKVRAGLTAIEQFVTDKGKVYTNARTFVELSEAVNVAGEEMKPVIAGKLSGEIFALRLEGNVVKFSVVVYPTDRDNPKQRATTRDGQPVDPQVLFLEVHDQELQHSFANIQNGCNVELGYRYKNMNNVEYDEFGDSVIKDSVDRLEVGKIKVIGDATSQPIQPQGFGTPNPQQQAPQDPFAGQGTVNQNLQQEVNSVFGNSGQGNGGFGFGN